MLPVPAVDALRAPAAVIVPRSKPPAPSFRVTAEPMTLTASLKLFATLFKVTLFPAPALMFVTPVTSIAPLCVTAPPALIVRFPLTVDAPKANALASVKKTALPLVIATVPKLLAAPVKVAELADPILRVVVPLTVMVVPAD
jgi:hypothetical protein